MNFCLRDPLTFLSLVAQTAEKSGHREAYDPLCDAAVWPAIMSIISNEVKTPLQDVVKLLHSLIENASKEIRKENLDCLHFLLSDLLGTVEILLETTRISGRKIIFEPSGADINNIAGNALAALFEKARKKGVALHLALDENICQEVLCDIQHLMQTLYSLLGTAIDFANEGYVTLQTKSNFQNDDALDVTFEIKYNSTEINWNELLVVLTKIGQADVLLLKQIAGAGLKLARCKRVLQHQQSMLEFSISENEGSRFFFTMTFEKVRKSVAQKFHVNNKEDNGSQKLRGIKVLVVDDNPVNIFIAKHFLKRWQAEVDVAENGKVAVDKSEQNKYNIILMDLDMPVLDGYEATRLIRSRDKLIPIVALTAGIDFDTKERAATAGMNRVMSKPFDPEELFEVIEKKCKALLQD